MQNETTTAAQLKMKQQLANTLNDTIESIRHTHSPQTLAVYESYRSIPEIFVPYLFASINEIRQLSLIQAAGLSINTPLPYGAFAGTTPLFNAITTGSLETVRFFRKHHCDFNARILLRNHGQANYLFAATLHQNLVMLTELATYLQTDKHLREQLYETTFQYEGRLFNFYQVCCKYFINQLSASSQALPSSLPTSMAMIVYILSLYQPFELEKLNHRCDEDETIKNYAECYQKYYASLNLLTQHIKAMSIAAQKQGAVEDIQLYDTDIYLTENELLAGKQFLHQAILRGNSNDLEKTLLNIEKLRFYAMTEALAKFKNTNVKSQIKDGLKREYYIDACALVGDIAGLTPLLLAVVQGNVDSVVQLLEANADIDARATHPDYLGITPLLAALANGYMDIVEKLVIHAWTKKQHCLLTEMIMVPGGVIIPLVFVAFSGKPLWLKTVLNLMKTHKIPFSLPWPYDEMRLINGEEAVIHFLLKEIQANNALESTKMTTMLMQHLQQLSINPQQIQSTSTAQPATSNTKQNTTATSSTSMVPTQPAAIIEKSAPAKKPKPPKLGVTAKKSELSKPVEVPKKLTLTAEMRFQQLEEGWHLQKQNAISRHKECLALNQRIRDFIKEYQAVFPDRKLKNCDLITIIDTTRWNLDIADYRLQIQHAIRKTKSDDADDIDDIDNQEQERKLNEQVLDRLVVKVKEAKLALESFSECLKRAEHNLQTQLDNFEKCKLRLGLNNSKKDKQKNRAATATNPTSNDISSATLTTSSSASSSPEDDYGTLVSTGTTSSADSSSESHSTTETEDVETVEVNPTTTLPQTENTLAINLIPNTSPAETEDTNAVKVNPSPGTTPPKATTTSQPILLPAPTLIHTPTSQPQNQRQPEMQIRRPLSASIHSIFVPSNAAMQTRTTINLTTTSINIASNVAIDAPLRQTPLSSPAVASVEANLTAPSTVCQQLFYGWDFDLAKMFR